MSRSLEAMEIALRAFESGRAADRAEAMVALRAALITPPRLEWVSLTDEERYLGDARAAVDIEYARAIEAKLKEKNT